MSSASIRKLKSTFLQHCATLGVASEYSSWFRTAPEHDGSAHVEVDGPLFYFVVTERGLELERRQTASTDELLYWLMYDVTSDMARKYELHTRCAHEDSRRKWFAEKERLLALLRPEWAAAWRAETLEILAAYPFRDPQ